MRKTFLTSILFAFLALPASCAAPASPCPTTPAVIPLTPPIAREISLEQLKRMLPSHPIIVGFDVDDTLIFSAPAFNALQPGYDPAVIRPKSYAALTPLQKIQYHDFWDKLNKEYDDRSIPKKIGHQLLDLHAARGDTIIIISKRQSPSDGSDPCTPRYEKWFHTRFSRPVIQTELQDKTPFICQCHIDYYYGDSDSYITAAVAAGATRIRVKRSPHSYAQDTPHNGQLNEIVLQDSEN
jgi:acid phosphatase (class B)